jgi:proteasome accessory factor B
MPTPPTPTKLQRHLDLIACLVGRHLPITVDEIVEAVPAYAQRLADAGETKRASVRRMFERDKDELRRAGIPLRTVQYAMDHGMTEMEGYLIDRRDFYLPYLRLVSGERGPPRARRDPGPSPAGTVELSEEDAAASLAALRRVAQMPAFPLAAEARSAFRKLAFDIAPDALPPETILFVEPPGAEEVRTRLRLLADALLARKHVRFRYRGMYRDEESERHVAGFGLLFQHANWYLIGHDRDRGERRVFRVDRMAGVVADASQPNRPDYEVPADFRLDEYARREAWELGGEEEAPLHARVLFHFPASLVAERNGQGELVEPRADGAAVRAFRVHQIDPFVRWLLSLEGEAEILEPAALRDRFRHAAARIAEAHGESAHA